MFPRRTFALTPATPAPIRRGKSGRLRIPSSALALQIRSSFRPIARWLPDTAGWRHLTELTSAGRDNDLDLKNLVVWAKDNAGMAKELGVDLLAGQKGKIEDVLSP